MLNLVWTLFLGLLLGLLIVAGVRLRSRVGARLVPRTPLLDDEAIRRIEETGFLRSDDDEPLDLEQIQEEERRFWASEEWDEADEL